MLKRIGILGGISHESTIAYYERILRKYFARIGNYYYPEIIIYSLDFQRFTDHEDRGERVAYIDYIVAGINALTAAGADFAIMAANSPHAVFAEVAARVNIPLLSIVQVTAAAAQREGLRKVLLLGIKFTMQAPFYPMFFAQQGITVITPADAEQDEINRLIFDEFVIGDFRIEAKARLIVIIENYVQNAAIDGVILGCTELPLILKPGDCTVPLLDTLDLHAQAALEMALA